MNKKATLHDKAVTEIYRKPSIIGLDDVVLSAKEVNLFKKNGDLYHQPDNICIDPEKQVIYNIEYKLNSAPVKARIQLIEQETWLRHLFPDYRVENLYVTKNFKVEHVNYKRRYK